MEICFDDVSPSQDSRVETIRFQTRNVKTPRRIHDDDDETLYRKLTAAKIARKRAEEDLKLLTNRIKLLKSEENKAHKKINETRKRANDIFG